MTRSNPTDVDVLLAALEMLRKGVYTLNGEELMRYAEATQRYAEYVRLVVERNRLATEPAE